MNDEQFEQEQLDRDNAYKQALARVEAERERWRGVAEWIETERDAAMRAQGDGGEA